MGLTESYSIFIVNDEINNVTDGFSDGRQHWRINFVVIFSFLKINLELLTNVILERHQTRINCLSHNRQYMVLKVALSHETLWLESADVVCNITAATHDNSHQDNGFNTEGLCTIYILLQYLLYLWVQVCWWSGGGA